MVNGSTLYPIKVVEVAPNSPTFQANFFPELEVRISAQGGLGSTLRCINIDSILVCDKVELQKVSFRGSFRLVYKFRSTHVVNIGQGSEVVAVTLRSRDDLVDGLQSCRVIVDVCQRIRP